MLRSSPSLDKFYVVSPTFPKFKFKFKYLTGRATIGRLELPPGEGRFVESSPSLVKSRRQVESCQV